MAKVYVAYGSNLNMEQMRDRCPTAEFIGTGAIENYELQFKGSLHNAHATIAPKEGSSALVGVWRIQKRDESHLDMYEGYNPKGYCYYNKEQIPVKMDDGSTLIGMVYIMDSRMDLPGTRISGRCTICGTNSGRMCFAPIQTISRIVCRWNRTGSSSPSATL